MAETQVHNLSVRLTASGKGLTDGLAEADKGLTTAAGPLAAKGAVIGAALGSALGKGITKGLAFGGLAVGVEGLFKTLEGGIKNPLKVLTLGLEAVSSTVEKIPVVGGLLALPFRAAEGASALFSAAVDRNQDDLLALGKAANRLGLDVATFQRFSLIPGLDVEAAEKLLGKFSKALGEAARQGPLADNAFTRLGLNARELAGSGMEETFKAVADKVSLLGNSTLQNAYAMQLFGKQGLLIAPALRQGGQAIDDVRKKIDDFGIGAGTGSFRSALELQKRAKEFQLLREGFFNQFSDAILPILGEINALFPKIKGGFAGLTDQIIDFAERGALALAGVFEFFRSGKVTEGVAELWKFIDKKGQEFTDKLAEGMVKAGEAFIDIVSRGLKDRNPFRNEFDLPGSSEAELKAKRAKLFAPEDGATGPRGPSRALSPEALALIERAQANPFGLGVPLEPAAGKSDLVRGIEAFFGRVKGRVGEVRDEVSLLGQSVEQVFRAFDLEKTLAGPAEKFREDTAAALDLFAARVPLFEQAGQFLGGLAASPSLGLGTVFPGLQAQLLAKAAEPLLASLGESRAPTLLRRGSVEEASAILAFQRRGEQSDPVARLQAVLEQQKQLQEEQVRVGERIEQAIREGRLKLEGVR